MSIPPLVCSTPPPPDQCEDDKDHEDFDLSYNLSQEDDDDDEEDNGYNYGNFSSYNTFQSTPENKAHEIKGHKTAENIDSKHIKEECLQYENEQQPESNIVVHNLFETNDIVENKLKCDEDMNIEDLDLKLDEEIEIIIANNSEQIETSESHDVKSLDIPHSSDNDSPSCDNINLSSFDDNVKDVSDSLKELNTQSFQEASKVDVEETHYSLQDKDISGLQESNEHYTLEESVENSETTLPYKHSESKPEEQVIDDDFGDFDDFQSINAKSNVTNIVDKSDDPWGSDDSNNFEFGHFTANFEENKSCTVESVVVKGLLGKVNTEQINCEFKETVNDSEADDGDFDDFKSSSIKSETNELIVEEASDCHDFPVFNLQSTDSEQQVLESITKVLSSVFLEEISEPATEYEGKLETLLSETWGHLMETDERQPYIVNWNNSLGQKTLLKALCIDSRNILFGPKWSSNMPKYAANLSNAPLQPHKQASVPSTFVLQNEIVTEKQSSKPTTWNDPFTTDDREFTYAETLLLDLEHLMATLDQMAHNQSTLKISELLSHACNTENESAPITPGPTDLDVFEAAAPTKLDKIFSNTIGVQPLRQISLPDTHIFTPTDSEIPRSKTIHYDRPTVLIPQSENQNQIDKNIPNDDCPLEASIDHNEYWEFQNFKSTSDITSVPSTITENQQITPTENNLETATTVNAVPKPIIAYQTELLQPIKVEHAMPTLNWPEPGDVRQTYDDFSDFVSISSQPSETQDRNSLWSAEYQDNTNKNKLSSFSGDPKPGVGNPDANVVDVDFDTFQSAQPSRSTSQKFKTSFPEKNTQIPSSRNIEYDNTSSKFESIKSDAISFENIARPNKALTHNVGFNSNQSDLTNKSPLSYNTQMQTNILQPFPASFSNIQTQLKSTQILQPLSLESYSQINWPSPGIDLQDLSRFNPVESVHSLKNDLSAGTLNKTASPIHTAKTTNPNQAPEDDMWGDFVSSKPKQQQSQPKKPSVFVDDDEWTDFISSPSVKPINGLNTISLNVHTNSSIQKSVQNKYAKKSNQPPLDIPTLNYITPKSNTHMSYNDKHFQNL